ncbi:MAG: hypothetical protein KatS3mg010_1563 [Acidimicrobiia bacterium]|nr:MAG: hypothetical protein KatS3mg010_1563 [Acidimicrobiia bacterium]
MARRARQRRPDASPAGARCARGYRGATGTAGLTSTTSPRTRLVVATAGGPPPGPAPRSPPSSRKRLPCHGQRIAPRGDLPLLERPARVRAHRRERVHLPAVPHDARRGPRPPRRGPAPRRPTRRPCTRRANRARRRHRHRRRRRPPAAREHEVALRGSRPPRPRPAPRRSAARRAAVRPRRRADHDAALEHQTRRRSPPRARHPPGVRPVSASSQSDARRQPRSGSAASTPRPTSRRDGARAPPGPPTQVDERRARPNTPIGTSVSAGCRRWPSRGARQDPASRGRPASASRRSVEPRRPGRRAHGSVRSAGSPLARRLRSAFMRSSCSRSWPDPRGSPVTPDDPDERSTDPARRPDAYRRRTSSRAACASAFVVDEAVVGEIRDQRDREVVPQPAASLLVCDDVRPGTVAGCCSPPAAPRRRGSTGSRR